MTKDQSNAAVSDTSSWNLVIATVRRLAQAFAWCCAHSHRFDNTRSGRTCQRGAE